jgi:hypothetical protein
MPQLAGLFLQGFDNMGMGVAETGDADSTGEIQESPIVRGKKIGPFPALESQIRRVIRGQDGGNHVTLPKKIKNAKKIKNGARPRPLPRKSAGLSVFGGPVSTRAGSNGRGA